VLLLLMFMLIVVTLSPAVDEGTDGTFCIVKNYDPFYTYAGVAFDDNNTFLRLFGGDTDDLIYLWNVF